uniref:Phospholipase C n=1 Tax=Dictyoglomus thermophilum TaxID=14 RepID=A0A7C3MK74_DICTH
MLNFCDKIFTVMRRFCYKKLFVYFLIILLLSTPILGWGGKTHQKIAKEAFYALPKEYQKKLSPYFDEIIDGSTAPDRIYRDFDSHIYHVYGSKGKGPEKVREKYLEIIRLIQDKKPWRLIAFQLGVLSHYIADLNQPLHTATSKTENLFHSKYEKDAEVIEPKRPKSLKYISYPMSYIIERAKIASKYYSDIERAYLRGKGFSDVSKITQRQIDEATFDVASYFYSALERGTRGTSFIDLVNDLIDYIKGIFFRLKREVTK